MTARDEQHSYQPTLIFIVGPTATGKSSLALQLAREYNAHILSADSRQVYKGLEITSGADIPQHFARIDLNRLNAPTTQAHSHAYFANDTGQKIFGVAMLEPDTLWSIAQFRDYALQVIATCADDQKNLVIVGGSGLYLRSLLIDDPRITIPPNDALRNTFIDKSVQELQHHLATIAPDHFHHMNQSDIANPRRLIRAIEVFSVQENVRTTLPSLTPFAQHWIGLHADMSSLRAVISHRVQTRITNGAIREVERLMDTYPNEKLAAYSATGVKEIAAFVSDQISSNELEVLWTTREFKYAKRQMTWFAKQPQITWYTAGSPKILDQLRTQLPSVQEEQIPV